ncbi:MAG: single-stranded DNA-binding protein [Rhodocyclaceae bacterium]|nr:single-stranded DNA-binding protein [Rhodocyclaceae bacterium]
MLNQLAVIGNLVADPKVGRKGETVYAILRVAVNRQWKNAKGEVQEETNFLTFKSFRPAQVEKFIEPHVKKGAKVYISGELRVQKNPTTIVDKDGAKKEVNIESIYFQIDKIELMSTKPATTRDEKPDTDSKPAGRESTPAKSESKTLPEFSDFNPDDFDGIPGPDGGV